MESSDKPAGTVPGAPPAARNTDILDLIGRFCILIIATLLTVWNGRSLIVALLNFHHVTFGSILALLGTTCVLVFLLLQVGFTILRLPPKSVGSTWLNRLTAVVGANVSLILIVLPTHVWRDGVYLIADAVIFIGAFASVWCISWLGRSFSYDAQARRLTTGGPYSIIRHPLYVSEMITIVGLGVIKLSWLAAAIVTVNILAQIWRARNEERVLAQYLPAYRDYAALVPMFIPRRWKPATLVVAQTEDAAADPSSPE